MKFYVLSMIIVLCVLIGASNGYAQGPKPLSQDTMALKEVVVKTTRPVSRFENDGIVTKIQGSPLQQVGTARDVLGFLPGVIASNDGVEVFGKGAPVIYINGKKIHSYQEIDILSSSQIRDVTVINNPGAKYASNVNAVIRITTIKKLGDGFAFDNRAVTGYRNNVYVRDVLWMNYRAKDLDVFTTLEYSRGKSKGWGKYEQFTWSPKSSNLTNMNMRVSHRRQLYDGKIGFNYSLGTKHTFGMFYQMSHSPSRSVYDNDYRHLLNDVVQHDSYNQQQNRDNETQHLIDGYYMGEWGRFSSEMAFDILWRSNKNGQDIIEGKEAAFHTNDNSKGRMLAGRINLSTPLWNGSIAFGAEYHNSRRLNMLQSELENIEDNDDKLVESNIGVFTEIRQKFGRVDLQLGLRYENINSDYYKKGLKMTEQSSSYNEAFPSLNVTIPVSKSAFQIGYARKYTRPHYSQLSSAVTYSTPTLYETGNPLLKSTYYDNLTLNYKWKWLILMTTYQYVSNPIIDVASSYKDNPEITLLSKSNSDKELHNLQCMVQIQPGMLGKHYYPVVAAGIISQFYSVEYRGTEMRLNNPMGIIKWMNLFMLNNRLRFNANLLWRSEGNAGNAKLGQSWQVDLSASKVFGRHWEVKLSANDIFNTASNNDFSVFSGARKVVMRKHNTSRSVELSVSYRFNVTRSKYKGTGTAQSEQDRL